MGVVNRRNAVLGWAVWTMAKRAARRKATGTAKSVSIRNGSSSRRSGKVAAAAVAGAAAAGGAVLFWRRSRNGADASAEEPSVESVEESSVG
jgi:hypothetical protein